jgi:hypothetical protein
VIHPSVCLGVVPPDLSGSPNAGLWQNSRQSRRKQKGPDTC